MDSLKRKCDTLMECSPIQHKVQYGGSMVTINDLTEGLLSEILIRLPVRSAHQCKSVCKRWYCLISDPYFVTQFKRHNTYSSTSQPPPLIFQYYNNQIDLKLGITSDTAAFGSCGFSLDFVPFVHGIRIGERKQVCVVGSSADLLLCCATTTYQTAYYVCNPVTMTWVQLPPIPPLDRLVHIGFICEPSFKGGKYQQGPYRFSVMRIPARNETSDSFHVQIFSSETGKWSEKVVFCPRGGFYLGFAVSSAVVCNGTIHLLSPTSRIFAYSPWEDQCRFIELPAEVGNFRSLCLGLSQGRLRLSQRLLVIVDEDEDPMIIWELKDYIKGEWCLEHRVCLEEMVSETRVLMESIKKKASNKRAMVIAFDPNDGCIMYMWIEDWIVLCNMRSMTLKVILKVNSIHCPSDMAFLLDVRCWPTPVPSLPQNALPHPLN